MVATGKGLGRAEWVKVVKRHKFPIIKEASPGDEMYGTVTIVYNTVLHICFWWVFLFVFFLSFLFIFLGLHTQHLEVPRLGIKLEL